ncbi:MAG: polymerase III subunit beta protein [Candidatus Moranbacteria bacterium GW2011_GWE1_35_17]|nr:MAG: polymerase III subunit beta protein [Candidatus Moranbacteria bacterium GW2011_GWE1_35_17]KKP83120.1 MAG: polymerase III subunit beta protein [Candidatus Moranbacteria bacterium GW2011_GWF2_35_54]
MKLVCTQENFKKAISVVDKITSKQITLPILKNILLETKDGRLIFSATNLEIGIISKIGAKIEQEGKIAVPSKLISDFIINLPKEENIEIELKGHILNINCGKYKAKINCLDSEDFPIIPERKGENQFTITNNKFKDVINKSLSSVSLNDIRVEFTGINLSFFDNKIYFAATDSFRLSEYEVEITENDIYKEIKDTSVIIPAETLRELNKILHNATEDDEVLVTIENNQIFFDVNDIKIVSRLINGKYPPYKQIIPSEFKSEILINKGELLQSIKIASVFTKKTDGEINIVIENDQNLVVKSSLQESGENQTELNINKKGENQNFVLNPRYLLDGLNVMDSFMIKIMVNDNVSPIVLKIVDEKNEKTVDNFIYIIMPIRK